MRETTLSLQPSATRGRISLWVEDALTKAYLTAVWAPEDTLFNISMAGSHSTVIGLVHDARLNGTGNVFGVVDCDFRFTNRPNWANTGRPLETFRLESHEVENLLFDWGAMAGCSANRQFHQRSEANIAQRAKTIASGMVWYMACRKVLMNNRFDIDDDYPGRPQATDLNTLQDALSYITSKTWYQSVAQKAQHLSAPTQIQADLVSAYQQYNTDLQSGDWERSYSGKEVYQQIRGWMTNYPNTTKADKDINFAKSIAEYQRTHQRIPQEVLDLKAALKTRVGI